jgi:hypothetical protein
LLARIDGTSRLTMLRQLRTTAHLQMAVARLIAAERKAEAEQEAEERRKQQEQEDEMRAYMDALKAEQEAERAQ